MIAFVLLLVCACASAVVHTTQKPHTTVNPHTTVKPLSPPEYVQSVRFVKQAERALHENILSMAPHIPDLSDPRRHYAELAHVVGAVAESLKLCIGPMYDRDYAWILNMTAADGIKKPQMVMDNTNSFLRKLMTATSQIRSLIHNQCEGVRDRDCNQVIDDEVKSDEAKYGNESHVLLAAGRTAKVFLDMESQFLSAAKHHSTHRYVVEGKTLLRDLVYRLIDLKRVMHDIHCF